MTQENLPKTTLPSSHPDYSRALRLKTLFNLTIEEYDEILAFQKGKCAICRKPPKEGGNRLSVDHDHKTGLIRGLLCWNCNRALGRLKDDLERIESMVEFLRHPPATMALGDARYGRKGRTTNKRRTKRSTTKRTTRARKK